MQQPIRIVAKTSNIFEDPIFKLPISAELWFLMDGLVREKYVETRGLMVFECVRQWGLKWEVYIVGNGDGKL